jgi:membrane-associated phospholipid phosphatase
MGARGVFARASAWPLVIGGATAGVAALFDDQVRHAIGNPDSDFGDVGDAAGGGSGLGGFTCVLFVAGRLSAHQGFRDTTYDMLNGLLVAQTYTALIKSIVDRPRPDGSETSRIGSSFPSGHSSGTFALATVIERHAGWKAGVPAYAVASLVAASRVRSNRHYLSDVVAGSTLGVIAGLATVRMNNRPLPEDAGGRLARVSIAPLGFMGLQLSFSY